MFNWKPVWVCSTRHWGDGKHKGFRKTCWKPRYAQVLRRLSCLLGAVGFFHETMYNVEHPNISQLYSSLYWCQGPRDERRREVVRSHGRNSGNCKWSNVWLRFISRWTTSRLGLKPLKPTWTNLPLSTLCKQAIGSYCSLLPRSWAYAPSAVSACTSGRQSVWVHLTKLLLIQVVQRREIRGLLSPLVFGDFPAFSSQFEGMCFMHVHRKASPKLHYEEMLKMLSLPIPCSMVQQDSGFKKPSKISVLFSSQ